MTTNEKTKNTVTLMMEKKVWKYGKTRKKDQRLGNLEERSSIFNNVHMCSIVDACILTSAFKFIEENFKGAIQKDPTYIWDIY